MMASYPEPEVNVSLGTLSPKHLIGQCIEMCQQFLVEIIKHYCNTKGQVFPPTNMTTSDLLGYVSYITDISRFDSIVQVFIKELTKDMKHFLKTWLFEMRSTRNAWAHWDSKNLNHLLAFRAFETLHLIYTGFDGHRDYQLYNRIQTYRLYLMNHVLRESLGPKK